MTDINEMLNEEVTDSSSDLQAENKLEKLKRYLTFVSNEIIFAVEADNVVEIINNHSIRSIPNVPSYIMGVINLRGQIIPIIDARIRMGKEFKEYDSRTCIIILNISGNIIGIVVDSVLQVIDIDTNKTVPIPIKNREKLTSSMISLDDGTIVLIMECDELIDSEI